MGKLFLSIGSYIENRQYFLRVVFFIAALVSASEGIFIFYIHPDISEIIELRIFFVFLFIIFVGLTFRKDWLKFNLLFFSSYLLIAVWINFQFYSDGILDRMQLWLYLCLFACGYIIQDNRLFHFQHIFYLSSTLVMLVFLNEPMEVKANFATVFIPFFISSYLLLINLKRNKEKLLQLNAELNKKSQIFEKAQAIALMGNWEFDSKTYAFIGSSQLYKILELEEGKPLEVEACLALFDPATQEKILPALNACRKEGISFELKIPMKTFKGRDRFIRFAGFGELIEGQVSRLYGVCQNLTADHKAGMELLEAKEAAEQASNAKSQFLSVMSHEIRTPMNAVIGSTNLLYEDNPREDQKDMLQTLQYSSKNLLYLINDILDFSKIEAGGIELEYTSFHLQKHIKNIINTFSFQAEEKALDLRTEFINPLPTWVKSDTIRIGQIISNLVSNALKFTKQGEIVVRVKSKKQDGNIHWIKIEISDTGIGIPHDKKEQIFEQFTQAESNTTRKYGGTGLGLAITKKLLHLMGSEIKVMSQVEIGTTFHFTIPFEMGEEVVEEKNQTLGMRVNPNPSPILHILIAEDNLVNIKIISKFLDKWGFTQTVVHNGQDAVDRVSKESYDLILMDLQMPIMGGLEASKEIRSKGFDLPIIALSAEVSEQVKDLAIQAGMNDYCSKPFVPSELKNKILTCTHPQTS